MQNAGYNEKVGNSFLTKSGSVPVRCMNISQKTQRCCTLTRHTGWRELSCNWLPFLEVSRANAQAEKSQNFLSTSSDIHTSSIFFYYMVDFFVSSLQLVVTYVSDPKFEKASKNLDVCHVLVFISRNACNIYKMTSHFSLTHFNSSLQVKSLEEAWCNANNAENVRKSGLLQLNSNEAMMMHITLTEMVVIATSLSRRILFFMSKAHEIIDYALVCHKKKKKTLAAMMCLAHRFIKSTRAALGLVCRQ